MKQKLAVPAFKSEAEEAEWWYKNRARLDKDFVAAAKKGKLKRFDQATLKLRLGMVTIRVPFECRLRARYTQASNKFHESFAYDLDFSVAGCSVNAASVGPDVPRGSRLGPEGLNTLELSVFASKIRPRKPDCISSQF